MCDFGDKEFKIMKLPLKKCSDEEAYIEVGLKGSPSKESKSRSMTKESNKDQTVLLM